MREAIAAVFNSIITMMGTINRVAVTLDKTVQIVEVNVDSVLEEELAKLKEQSIKLEQEIKQEQLQAKSDT